MEHPTPRPVNPGFVILGGVLGFGFSWVWIGAAIFFGFAGSYDAQDGGGFMGTWVFGVLVALLALAPLIVSILLLVLPRTRQAGAGVVMGLAIGSVVASGVCASILLPGLGY